MNAMLILTRNLFTLLCLVLTGGAHLSSAQVQNPPSHTIPTYNSSKPEYFKFATSLLCPPYKEAGMEISTDKSGKANRFPQEIWQDIASHVDHIWDIRSLGLAIRGVNWVDILNKR